MNLWLSSNPDDRAWGHRPERQNALLPHATLVYGLAVEDPTMSPAGVRFRRSPLMRRGRSGWVLYFCRSCPACGTAPTPIEKPRPDQHVCVRYRRDCGPAAGSNAPEWSCDLLLGKSLPAVIEIKAWLAHAAPAARWFVLLAWIDGEWAGKYGCRQTSPNRAAARRVATGCMRPST